MIALAIGVDFLRMLGDLEGELMGINHSLLLLRFSVMMTLLCFIIRR